jgi:hypothetical protein
MEDFDWDELAELADQERKAERECAPAVCGCTQDSFGVWTACAPCERRSEEGGSDV